MGAAVSALACATTTGISLFLMLTTLPIEIRVEICRDRLDQWPSKIFARAVQRVCLP